VGRKSQHAHSCHILKFTAFGFWPQC
jgi:hypothetical protein